MIARRVLAMLVLAAVLGSTGCAVGRFIAGAPGAGAGRSHDALLVRRCSGCHEVPDPATMSAADWQSALARMKRRMQLPAAEWDSLAAM